MVNRSRFVTRRWPPRCRPATDSPFAWKLPEIGTDFWLEDLEDGALDTLGLSASTGTVRGPSNFTDSVDADGAGLMDHLGRDGHSYWVLPDADPEVADTSLTLSFDEADLGGLPSMVGLVSTDASDLAPVTFEAFDTNGVSLGVLDLHLGDGIHNGSTIADRFLGAGYDGGISSVTISSTFGGLEVDHIQYGGIVPVPSAIGLFGLALLGRRRRRA